MSYEVGKRIKSLREKQGYSQADIAVKIGYRDKASVSRIESGVSDIPLEKLLPLAKALEVPVDVILGVGDASAADAVRIPVYAYVGAGNLAFAEDEIVGEEQIPRALAQHDDYFGVKVKGDSMSPRIASGDTIIVRKQDTADDGDLVIVLIGNQRGLIKKLRMHANGISLLSTNPLYDPIFYTAAEIASLPVRIVGVAVELRSRLK